MFDGFCESNMPEELQGKELNVETGENNFQMDDLKQVFAEIAHQTIQEVTYKDNIEEEEDVNESGDLFEQVLQDCELFSKYEPRRQAVKRYPRLQFSLPSKPFSPI